MNILVLTSVYPQSDDHETDGVTLIVKEFVQEWGKKGHNVLVIHNSTKFPLIINMLPQGLIKKINSKFGAVLPNLTQRKCLINHDNNITSVRLPMNKFLPKTDFKEKDINLQFKKIVNVMNSENFSPDLVIGHWENPQIPLLSQLKDLLNIKTALVFHTPVYIKKESYRKKMIKHISNIDTIGARSKSIQKEVKQILKLETEPFLCYSGIPDKYFNREEFPVNNIEDKIPNSYLFAGRIIKRKNIDKSIIALSNHYNGRQFTFKIIGEGAEKNSLLSLTNNIGVSNNVEFVDHKNRNEILEIMNDTETFIMISDNETFGLAYIEALSRGCIVIASKSGGMDGIIVNNQNGFLCEQGNEIELEKILNKIQNMSTLEKKDISQNAIKTAERFRNSSMAKEYLINVT